MRLLDLGSATHARAVLLRLAGEIGLEKASWHGFRRGSATDLVARGGSLSQVLASGGWRSGAFLRYIAGDVVSRRRALELSFGESDSDRDE